MLRKLLAAFLLVLAISPFTAPFQTWFVGDDAAVDAIGVFIGAPGHHATHADDAGVVVEPIRTTRGHLQCLISCPSVFGADVGVHLIISSLLHGLVAAPLLIP
jgi:hypothetical protein